jgi:hypothetical protein
VKRHVTGACYRARNLALSGCATSQPPAEPTGSLTATTPATGCTKQSGWAAWS